MAPKRIGILGFDRLTTMHLAGPADAFAAAALEDGFGGRIPCYEVCLIGLKDGPFLSESGVTFRPAYNLRTAPELDTIIVPGGSGLRHPKISPVVSEWILSRTNQTRRIASVCTGIYGLAPTGLLDGREVTTCRSKLSLAGLVFVRVTSTVLSRVSLAVRPRPLSRIFD